jgi:hypothetical protein
MPGAGYSRFFERGCWRRSWQAIQLWRPVGGDSAEGVTGEIAQATRHRRLKFHQAFVPKIVSLRRFGWETPFNQAPKDYISSQSSEVFCQARYPVLYIHSGAKELIDK